MSSSEGRSEIQLSQPHRTFPFGPTTSILSPHTVQWCRFSIPERLPLKPFRQDRLTRLPLPPSVMATSKVASYSGTGTSILRSKYAGGVDPFQKVQQLEKNLIFVQENHAYMLRGLHEEIVDLKSKNRELQFQLVTGLPALPQGSSQQSSETETEKKDKIEKLEKEIRKLRAALKEAIISNTALSDQLQVLKREKCVETFPRAKGKSKTPPDSAHDDRHHLPTPSGPSPQMEEYSETLKQIQKAHRNGKRGEKPHLTVEGRNEWVDGYVRSGNSYHHHRHHHHHHRVKSPQQHQARLPRLPLRNQQNYPLQQYEVQYHQRNTNALPALKHPLIPVVDHHIEKPRKQRPAKIVDQAING